MSFQILNKEGNAIPINELDKEAAEFWGKQVHLEQYASPFKPEPGMSEMDILRADMTSNWFDVVGRAIHQQGFALSGWANVVHTMIAEHISSKFIDSSKGYEDRPVLVPEFVEEITDDASKVYHLPDKIEIKIWGILAYYRPHINLINHWQSKGYTPLQVKE